MNQKMKTLFSTLQMILVFHLINGFLGTLVSSQQSSTDSCSSTPSGLSLRFDPTSLRCASVWSSQGFILQYGETATNTWSFVLSAPDANSYISVGFSTDGGMVGASAVAGWVSSDGAGTVKQYYLVGKTPSTVVADRGNLDVVANSSSITSLSSRLYMAFQLNTNKPLSGLIYAVGLSGLFPSAPSYKLSEHQDMTSTSLIFLAGQSSTSDNSQGKLKQSHGVLNMLGWGILTIIGAMAARYFKHLDPPWFYAHILIQSLAFLLGIAGVISGFVLEDRLSADVSTHKGIGVFILMLSCLQVAAFLARPGLGSKVRKYWNWYHHNVGRLLVVFAIANVLYGIHLGGEGGGWNAGYGIVVALLFVGVIVLEVRMWVRK